MKWSYVVQWLKHLKKMLSSYWIDAILLIVAVGAPLLSAWLSFILEFRQVAVDKDARDPAWAAAKRRSWAGTAVVGQLPTPRKAIAAIALALVMFEQLSGVTEI